MNFEMVDKIAKAVLYEGYMLYPYRPSSVKNRQRFNFGVLTPEAYGVAQSGTEASSMQTECLVLGNENTAIEIKIRFLQLQTRQVERGDDADFHPVESLDLDGRLFLTWQEAIEREIGPPRFHPAQFTATPLRQTFRFPEKQETELLHGLTGPNGSVAGRIVRTQQQIMGSIEVAVERATGGLYKVAVRVINHTPLDDAERKTRSAALMYSFVSTHTILCVSNGEFVSLLDPPEEFRAAAASCSNVGAWPVLVGEDGEREWMLSSPIILYDYPAIAPESAGDLFDGTEIDEILMLRIMTLSDDEKREMRAVDERGRQILERTETLPAEQLMKLHGIVRGARSFENDRHE